MALALALVAACRDGAAPASTPSPPLPPEVPPPEGARVPTGPFVVGVTVTDPDGWVEYVPGDMPLLLIAPHGGVLQPSSLAPRNCVVITATVPGSDCSTGNDDQTQDLARRLVESIVQRTGHRPHLLVNLLHRNRFDGNRDRAEATGTNAALDRTWTWWQAFADSARARMTAVSGRALVLDLHGHAHPQPRLEWGYLLGRTVLNASDSLLDRQGAAASVRRLATDARSGLGLAALIRGPHSLGGLLQAAGYPGVPSPGQQGPGTEEYFTGGFNTARNGSRDGGAVDAVQLEAHGPGVRDTPASRAAFATALAGALDEFLRRHYGWTP